MALQTKFNDPVVRVEVRNDGTVLLRTDVPFEPRPVTLLDYLQSAAESVPERTFLAQRTRDDRGWETLSYGDAARTAQRIAGYLLRERDALTRPILILSGNSIAHQLVALGAMYAGIPYAPLSVAYSTLSKDFGRLKHILGVLNPGLVFLEDPTSAAPALSLPEMAGRTIVCGDSDVLPHGAVPFSRLALADPPQNFPDVGPGTVAKYLFTSGSTGTPKGVPTTHRMMCGSLDQIEALCPFVAAEPPVVLDWLPWSHVFGGSFSLNTVLRYSGTLHIDAGKPTPSDISTTIRNLRDVNPTMYWNVPRGYELLIPHLLSDADLASSLFAKLSMLFYAGASLSPRMSEQLLELARRTTGRSVPMMTSWGLTETAPSITIVNRDEFEPGNIGIPMPGLDLKMVPSHGKFEARVRGPTVMSEYFSAPEATAAAFDEEGYFKTGDAIRLSDECNASKGIIFDGRVTEDFKLSSGTWIDATAIRSRALQALAGLAMDVVVTGEDQRDIGLLILLSPGVEDCSAFKQKAAAALSASNSQSSGSSQRIARAIVLRNLPKFDAGEITEKGSLNSRLIRQRNADVIARLHSEHLEDDVIRTI